MTTNDSGGKEPNIEGNLLSDAKPSLSNTDPFVFEQYKLLVTLELESTKLRHTTFTAILAVSFVLPGLALKADLGTVPISVFGLTETSLSGAVFLLGFIFYLFALFHYAWHHRYAHGYRKQLKVIESQLGIQMYRLRVRPKIGRFKLHFDWALHMIAVVYGAFSAAYCGWRTTILVLGLIVGMYGLRMLLSGFEVDEPLE